ncbi:MAG TPA: alpha/beta hydrolase, partial [Actinomycetota bacterium]|nr:alpha/beta hydrolase [Actinomycetota bacterium]
LALPAGPPVSELRAFRRPILFLSGDRDDYCPAEELGRLARRFPRAEVVLLPGTNHHLWRREREAAELVGDFADRTVAAAAERPGQSP